MGISNNNDIMNQVWEFLVKFISIPALVAVGAKIAVQIKRKKATWVNSFISICVALFVAYLTTPYIVDTLPKNLHGAVIGLVAIVSEHFIEYVVFEFKIGVYIEKLLDIVLGKFKGGDAEGEEENLE